MKSFDAIISAHLFPASVLILNAERVNFEQQATFKERLLQYADEVVLLIDSSKFNYRSEYFFAGIEDIDHIITDDGIDTKLASEIRRKGLKLTITE